MNKKIKLKSNRASSSHQKDHTQALVTQQEQRMFYSGRKNVIQQSGHSEKYQKYKKKANDQEDQDNIQQVQLSNLNQTSAEEIADYINKLISKNKVTSKNAFDIPLIHLQQMEDFRASLNQNTWKRLSSTLQNDYKIYGYRVDATHTNTYKMVQSLARHEATADQNFGNSRQHLQKNQQLKKSGNNDLMSFFKDTSYDDNISINQLDIDYKRHIQKNQSLIDVSHIESFFSYNPGLQRTKRQFDQQGLKGLLLNNICLQNGCELKIDEHKNNKLNEQEVKKQSEEINQKQVGQIGYYKIDKILENIFDQNSEDRIITQDEQNDNNIFDEIFSFNLKECGINGDDYEKFLKIYCLVSGQKIVNKKNKLKEKIVQQSNQQNISNNLNFGDNKNNLQVNLSQIHQQSNVNEQYLNNQNIQEQNEKQNKSSQEQKKDELKDNPNNENQQSKQSHILCNKNFEMHELKIDNMLSSQSSHQQSLQNEYISKYKSIQQYIKIKQPTKKPKQNKIHLNEFNQQQIANKLFNKKIKKSKLLNKIKIKQQQGQAKKDKKANINFDKLNKSTSDLKRQLIFKKSVPQERLFNQTKQKIINKLKFKQQKKISQQQEDNQKRKKGKKISKLFDLPIYQFQQGDTNYIQPYQQIDPQTSQLEFTSLYKNHLPSFVFSSNLIINDLKRKKLQKQKELQQKRKQLQEQKRQQLQQPIQINEEHTNQQNNEFSQEYMQPDMSFINDQMGQMKGQQVTIRQARQKVRKLMLKKLNQIKIKNAKSKKVKLNSISFQQLYQAYYHQHGFISPALCFITILHLANQHNLVLQRSQDETNFKIMLKDQNHFNLNLMQNHESSINLSISDRDASNIYSQGIQEESNSNILDSSKLTYLQNIQEQN